MPIAAIGAIALVSLAVVTSALSALKPPWDDDDLNQLKEIPGSAFEVVRSQAEVHVC